MSGRITKEGTYQLFLTPDGDQVLSLGGHQMLMVSGPQDEYMVGRHGDFERQRFLARGDYKFVEFDDEDREDHLLFLQRNGNVHVVTFHEGLPEGPDEKVRVDIRHEPVGIDEVDIYVQSLQSGEGGEREELPHLETFADIYHVLGSLSFPAEKQQILNFAHRQQAADEVIERLQGLEARNYASLHDVRDDLRSHEQVASLGIEGLSTEELIDMIEAMEPAELEQLRNWETRHDSRDDVIEAIDRRLHH